MQEEKLNILRKVLGRYYQSGPNEFLFACPFCNHHKRKLSVNVSKGFYKCWVCDVHGRNLTWLVRRFGDDNTKQEWFKFDSSDAVEISDFDNLFASPERPLEKALDLPAHYVSLASKTLPRGSEAPLRYLSERGVDWFDIVRWKIGYCPKGEYAGRIIVPSFSNEGYINFYVGRSYTGDWPSYKNPNVNRDLVFNELYVDWDKDIVLVEGVFDAINADNSIPLLGSTFREGSKLFQEIVRRDSKVYVALDADAKRKSDKVINSLLMYGVTVFIVDTDGYEDVGKMGKNIFLERKKTASIMNPHYYLYTRFLEI